MPGGVLYKYNTLSQRSWNSRPHNKRARSTAAYKQTHLDMCLSTGRVRVVPLFSLCLIRFVFRLFVDLFSGRDWADAHMLDGSAPIGADVTVAYAKVRR